MTYGKHMTLDLENCNVEKLQDLNFIADFLNDLPEKINMKAITRPYVFKYKSKKPEDYGITGFLIIAESHISVHTYPKKKYCFVDIFSCNDFNLETKHIVDYFEAKGSDVKSITRGIKFPR